MPKMDKNPKKKGKKHMKKNTKKKFKDIRNAIVMMCVMVAMMSTASYAWFTMSSSPTVTGMKMTATTSGGGLQVANVIDVGGQAGTYYSSIKIKENAVKTLKPVTPDTSSVGQFLKPLYQGNTVKDVVAIDDGVEFTDYVAKYEFWLKSIGPEDVKVGIVCGDSADPDSMGLTGDVDGGLPVIDGSFVRKSLADASPATVNPSYAVRVGFVPREVTAGGSVTDPQTSISVLDKMFIWEPNAEADAVTKRAESTTVDGGITETLAIRSHTSGKIMSLTDDTVEDNYTSAALFKLKGEAAVRIEMYVWLQGSDMQCGDEIQAGNLEAQVQFTPVE